MDLPSPPAHLSPSARQWWQSTVERFVLEEHHLRLLQLACEAWDRSQAARAQLCRSYPQGRKTERASSTDANKV
jgi:phage terminase small subunit